MANELKLSNESASEAADATCALLDGGLLRIYDGAKPATADTAIGAQVLLAELTFGNPAFGAAVNGVATANAISSDTNANDTGTAAWFRAVKGDGNPVFDGTVGTSGADLNLNTVSIVAGAEIQVSSMTYTQPKA